MSNDLDQSVDFNGIVNGSRDPQAVDLTDALIMAIGWLYGSGSPSSPFCIHALTGG